MVLTLISLAFYAISRIVLDELAGTLAKVVSCARGWQPQKEPVVEFNEASGARPPGPEQQPPAELGRMTQGALGSARDAALSPRLQAMTRAARYYGVELDPEEFRGASGGTAESTPPRTGRAAALLSGGHQGEVSQAPAPSAAALSLWAQNAGLWSRAVRIRWRHLLRLRDSGPVVLLLSDGGAGLLTGVDAERNVVFLKPAQADPNAPAVAVDELRLSEVWTGEAVLLRARRGQVATEAPFNLRWLAEIVLQEKHALRDIGIASFTISVLTIFPPLLVMAMVNRCCSYHSVSTLILLSALMAIFFLPTKRCSAMRGG